MGRKRRGNERGGKMEYSRTFKSEQGVELEMKVKVECFTEESMREALSLIAQS